MTQEKVVIIGGSITGLTGALALHAQGFDVTIVESDPSPPPSITPENSDTWMRRGALHARQPHVLTARLRNVLHEWYPDLVRDLLDAGAWEQPFADTIHPDVKASYQARPEDAAITVLMSRRTTLELVMRRHVEARGVATLLAGTQVTSLIIEGDRAPITVRGVRIKDGEGERELRADLVVDASGRTTKFAEALRRAGAVIADEHHQSNSVYYARHYRLLPGKSFPDTIGLPGVIYGDFTIGPLPADNGAMVVTFGAFKDDPLLNDALGRPKVFQQVCMAIPRAAEWVDPSRSEPTSDVMSWANMDFLWRTTIKDGAPQVLGFFFAGDATLRSNPKYGRGCTCGTIGSHVLAETLASTTDPAERLRRYEAALFKLFRREWEELLEVDHADYERFRLAAELRPPSLIGTWRAKLQDHVLRRAMVLDPRIHRTIIKGFFGLAEPTRWTRDITTWLRIAAAALPNPRAAPFKGSWKRPSREAIKAMIETHAKPA